MCVRVCVSVCKCVCVWLCVCECKYVDKESVCFKARLGGRDEHLTLCTVRSRTKSGCLGNLSLFCFAVLEFL